MSPTSPPNILNLVLMIAIHLFVVFLHIYISPYIYWDILVSGILLGRYSKYLVTSVKGNRWGIAGIISLAATSSSSQGKTRRVASVGGVISVSSAHHRGIFQYVTLSMALSLHAHFISAPVVFWKFLFSDSIDLSAVVLKYSFFLLCHNPLHTLPQFVYPFCCLWTLVSAFLQVQSYSEHSFT